MTEQPTLPPTLSYTCPRCGRAHIVDDLRGGALAHPVQYIGPFKISQVLTCPVTLMPTFFIDESGFDV